MVRVVKPVKQAKPQVKAKSKLRKTPTARPKRKNGLAEYQVTWC